jgi:uncharacterized protein YndB with AHSA1/START domain
LKTGFGKPQQQLLIAYQLFAYSINQLNHFIMPSNMVTVETSIAASIEKVWEYWTTPAHITQWNNASEDWTTPKAENDLRTDGRFVYRMEAKDGSFGFDFGGTYDEVKPTEKLVYTLDDGRKVTVTFTDSDNSTKVAEIFEPENTNTVEMQQTGWQAILDNFKKYVETNK